MLYVSRMAGLGRIGVVDTDDGVEDIVFPDDLRELIEDGFLSINGVTLSDVAGTLNTRLDIVPYQDPVTVTRLQAKMKVLHQINISVWRGSVTSLVFNPDVLTAPVDIVLSEFAPRVADCILQNCSERVSCHKITLVLDDNLSLCPQALSTPYSSIPLGRGEYGVVVDMRRVTDIDLVCSIYRQLFGGCFAYNGHVLDTDTVGSLQDIPERKRKMLGVCKIALMDVLVRARGSNVESAKVIESRMKDLYFGGRR